MQRRFVFDYHADSSGNRALYDTRRGRTEAIGKIDEEYVPLLEKLFAAYESPPLVFKTGCVGGPPEELQSADGLILPCS